MADRWDDFFEEAYGRLSPILALLLLLGWVEEVRVKFPGQGLGEFSRDLPMGLDLKGSLALSSRVGPLPREISMGIGLLLLLMKLKLSGFYWGGRDNLEFIVGGPVTLRLRIPWKLPFLSSGALQALQALIGLLLALDNLGLSDIYLRREGLSTLTLSRDLSSVKTVSPKVKVHYNHVFWQKGLSSKAGTADRGITFQGLLSLGLGKPRGEGSKPAFGRTRIEPPFPEVFAPLFRGAGLVTGLLLVTGLTKLSGIHLSREGRLSFLVEPSGNHSVKAGEAYEFF